MGDFDRDKIDEVVLALMQLTLHDGYRAWKDIREWREASSRWETSAMPSQKQLACPSSRV